jgi:hypothetical protein
VEDSLSTLLREVKIAPDLQRHLKRQKILLVERLDQITIEWKVEI